MKKGLIFLLGLLIIVFFWFIVPIILISLNIFYNLPIVENELFRDFGVLVFIVGFSGTLYTVHQHFLTGRVTPVAVETPKKFISKGLYKYCRNPMYIAILTAFLGTFMVFGHVLLLLYILTAVPMLHLFVVYVEEPELKRKFGKPYEDYLKRVPRWLPFKP